MLIIRRIQEDFFRLFNCVKYYFIINEIFGERCGPLKMMKPLLEDLKTKVGEGATILKIDVDKNPQVAQNYRIQGVPTLILFKNGEIKWRQSGVVQAHQLAQIIKQYSE